MLDNTITNERPQQTAGQKWRAYVINLDHSTDRLKRMQKRLEAAQIPWQRVPAIHGATLKPHQYAGIDRKGFLRAHGRHIEPGDIGCYVSHIKALQTFLASDDAFGLILEDDVAFEDDFHLVMADLLQNTRHWDVVQFAGRHHGMPVPQLKLSGNYRLVAFLTRRTGAGAYLVNRKAAQSYIEKLYPMQVPYDHVYDRAWKFKLKIRGVLPPVVRAQLRKDSTILPQRKAKQKYRKPAAYVLPKFLSRSLNEINRGLYSLTRGLFIPRCSWPKEAKDERRQ